MALTIPITLSPDYGDLPIPRHQTAGAVAIDLYAIEAGWLYAKRPTIVRFGISVAIPKGFEGQIRGRSGLAARGVRCHLGTIDQDYRGELKGLMIFEPEIFEVGAAFQFDRGDRMAQLVISPVVAVRLNPVEGLPETERGHGGFGSTGVAAQ